MCYSIVKFFLKERKFHFILIERLNQIHLENFFGTARACGIILHHIT